MSGWRVDMEWIWWIVGPVLVIAIFAGLSWVIANEINKIWPPADGGADVSAKQIAARRFAGGEIDEAEYTRIIDLLED